MVFDSARGRAVLFGGGSAAGVLSDTWEWDGQAWTQQQDTGPSARSHHAMAFDLVHNRVVLFGGNPGDLVSLGDTWSWDGSTWTQIATFGANRCFNAAMVSTDVQVAMFGGTDSSNAVFRETWVFDGQSLDASSGHRTPSAFFPCHGVRRGASYHCPLRWARSYGQSDAGHMGAHRNGSTSTPCRCVINNCDTYIGVAR